MTKEQELNVLRKAITELGADSYIGPWLSEQLPIVESFVRSDLLIDIDVRETIEQAQRAATAILENAASDADKILAQAKSVAAKIIDETKSERTWIDNKKYFMIAKLEALVQDLRGR